MRRTAARRTARLTAELLEGRDVPATAFALGAPTTADANTLFRFDTAAPNTLQATLALTNGLVAGDVFVGTDFRPSTGQLFGVAANLGANTLRVYTVNTVTGVVTPLGAGALALPAGNTIIGATEWGVDFNPAVDRIRVVNNLSNAGTNANNLVLTPDGTGITVDADLTVPAGATVIGAAYNNTIIGQPTATVTGTPTLYALDPVNDQLMSDIAPPYDTFTNVGPLGQNVTTFGDLDITGTANTAFAAATVGAGANLYNVNLTNGALTLVGPIGDGARQVADISIAPAPLPVVAGGSTNGQVQLLTPGVGGQVGAPTSVTVFANSTANVRSSAGDVNGDGVPDIVAVTGPGTPIRVAVVSGTDNSTVLVQPYDPFPGSNFTGGGFVYAGDIDRDGRAEWVVTPDQGGGPRVTIFSLQTNGTVATRANFFGIDDPNFRGGVRPSLGDVNGDGTFDLVVGAGFLGGPRVAIWNGTTVLGNSPTRLINDFFAFPGTDVQTLRNGVFVTVSDINGDGFEDLVFGGGPGGAPRVFILSGQLVSANNVAGAQNAPIANFFVAGNSTDRGGVRVAYADLDGDQFGDLTVGSGEGNAARVRAYRGVNFTAGNVAEPTTFQDVNVFGGAVLANGVFVG